MSEVIIQIRNDGTVAVEEIKEGVKGFKEINPDSLIMCINKSLLRGVVFSGLLPKGCISFTAHDNGDKSVCILHPERRADITYFGTKYKDFPLPKLVFRFYVNCEGKISKCGLGVVGNENNPKPTTPMFIYPF